MYIPFLTLIIIAPIITIIIIPWYNHHLLSYFLHPVDHSHYLAF